MSGLVSSFLRLVSCCNPFSCCFSSREDLSHEDQRISRAATSVIEDVEMPLLSPAGMSRGPSASMAGGSVSIYDQMRQDLNKTGGLSSSEFHRATSTISDIEEINQNLASISSLKSDGKMNKRINSITHAGAEDGFGANPQVLAERVNIFVKTYARAKSEGDLQGFFGCFSRGDPCLSGRSESLYKYAASLDNIDIDAIPDPEIKLHLPGTIFANFIMGPLDDMLEAGSLTKEMVVEAAEKNIDNIASEFARYGTVDSVSSFLEFLDVVGLYKKGDPVDWKHLIGNLIHSPSFNAVYLHSLTFVVTFD